MSDRIARFAELIVGFGANVQPGQVVAIGGEPGKEEIVRALATAAYRAGAKFVDATYFDLHVKRARLLYGAEDDLSYVPPWYGQRLEQLGEMRGARIGLTGPADPTVFEGVDPQRAGKDQMPFLKESARIVNERTTNWCAVPCPTPGWAALVHPDLEPEAALAKLWDEVMHVMRLDEADPIAAWRERMATMIDTAGALTERRLDAVRFRGEGTDLTVGLLPSSRWVAAEFSTVDGIVHMPNLPTEEIFTAPDPTRTTGVVRATKPLWLGGSIIEGLVVRFEEGRAVRIDADRNADVLRSYVERDEGAARLGELALVDGDGRIGPLGTTFYDTLLDENAASHVALGSAYAMCLEGDADAERINRSAIHVDFMIGSGEIEVDGLDASGAATPLLRHGSWQI